MHFDKFVQEMTRQLDLISAEMEKQIEGFSESVPPERQMQAFREMQPEDWIEMIEQRGLPNTLKYIREMRRREALSNDKSTIR